MTSIDNPRPSAKGLALSLLALGLLAGGFVLPACSAEQGDAAASPSDVVAKVNGTTITRSEVEDQAKQQLESAEGQLQQCQSDYERNRFQILDKTAHQMVEDQLIEAEATKRGVTKEELLATEVDAKVTPVTDEEVDQFYEQNKSRIPAPKEQVAERIKSYLGQQRQQEAREAFIKGLEKNAEIAYLLDPPRTKIDIEGAPARGPADAPVTIVEFSDFQCPFCARVRPTLEQVEKNYGDKVRLVFRQFPLPMHAQAEKAAEASLCAQEQGKFWDLHDEMFGNQQKLTVPDLKAKAGELGMDTEKFNQCLDSGKYAQEIQKDIAYGRQVGVSGTPSMFINGRFISGAVPYDQIASVIDDELARHGAKADGTKDKKDGEMK